MFGYVLPDKPEMKIKEYELFRAYYCGVCKSMGRNSGFSARMTLNYDTVFLGLVLSSLLKENIVIEKEGCIANPVKKKPVVKGSVAVDYASDINALLTFYKLKDDIRDEHSLKASALYPFFIGAYKKAKKREAKADQLISDAMEKLRVLEEEKTKSIDAAADPFGKLLGQIFVLGYEQLSPEPLPETSRTIEWLGYNLGKWIYTLDAFDDIEKDLKSSSYNPFVEAWRAESKTSVMDGLIIADTYRESVRFSLEQCLVQAAKAFELLEMPYRGILENIIYLGMDKKTTEILDKNCVEGCCKKNG